MADSSEACFASHEEVAPSHLAVSVVVGCGGRGGVRALRFAGEMGEEGRVLFCDACDAGGAAGGEVPVRETAWEHRC